MSVIDWSVPSLDAIAIALAEVVLSAGPAVMDVYDGRIDSRTKTDGSPTTLADERAEAIICARLREIAPDIPILAEEAASAGGAGPIGDVFFLVDPLDGTKEFLARNGEFTINVAYIRDGRPLAGAVYAPALNRLWFGGKSAFMCEIPADHALPARRLAIRCRPAPAAPTAVASRSHADPATESFLEKLGVRDRRSAGSSLKFCLLAEGVADVYPRFAPTMEWDTAAGDAVLRAAGGVVLSTGGGDLKYGKASAGYRNGGFVAWGDPQAADAAS